MICAEYKITNVETFSFAYVRDIPLNQCPAIFGFNAESVPKVFDWAQDAVAVAKARCQ